MLWQICSKLEYTLPSLWAFTIINVTHKLIYNKYHNFLYWAKSLSAYTTVICLRINLGGMFAMIPMILCTKYPYVSYSHRSYLRQAWAHCLRSGMVKDFFCFERGLTTNMGLTERISTFFNYFYSDNDYEKDALNALVAA